MSSSYQVAPIFLIRMAGVSFDVVEKLATPDTSRAARDLIVRQLEFSKAKSNVEEFLQIHGHELTKELFRAWKKAIRSSTVLPREPSLEVFAACQKSWSDLAVAELLLDACFHRELNSARAALFASAQAALPSYLLFVGEAARDRLAKQYSTGTAPPPRNKKERAHERTLLLYIQRICAKNDSLSAFGPHGWGEIDNGKSALTLAPDRDIARRECFLERWTAHGAAAALNADRDARLELAPRLNPNGRVDNDRFLFSETGETVSLNPETVQLLARCNGETPAHSLGVEPELLEKLAHQRILRWEAEVPALEPYAFDVLVSDVARWRDRPVRQRWLDLLQPIAASPARFAQKSEVASRVEIMDEARARLGQLGAARETTDRFLYSATNPICEECFRECGFVIGENLINEVAVDGAPWIDLWRDCYAFVASRVAASLRGVFEKMSIQNGAAPLPAFLRACELANLPLTGPGLVASAHIAFQEVKAAFHDKMKAHAAKSEYELSAEDCHFVRHNFKYDKFDEYTYPSADIQLAAKSVEAVNRGAYQWVLAELHPPVAMLHHGFYWSCPDKPALSRALTSTLFGRPNFYFGFFAADFTATTTVDLFDAVPSLSHFVAGQRGRPNWSTVRPADAEVYVDPASGDVCLRKIDNHQHLGSFARAWLIPLGFHPFSFSLGTTTPRLRCGKVIVQRRAWTVTQEELGAGDFTGISRDLVLAIERLRAKKDWPRHIYIRPTEQALRRSGAEGRDKDTKPVYVDLESYLFLEIFHRWLTKAGELEVTEMLPAPDDLLWREADGGRTFELRTLIVPPS